MTKYVSSGRWRSAALIGAIFVGLGPGAAARELNAPAESAAEPKTEQGLISLRVLWTVSGYVRGPNARVDDEQARSLIFSPMDMTEESISFAGQVCKPITFSRKTLSLRDYLWARHGIAPQHLNLEDQSAQVIKTTCELLGFSEFLRLEDSRLIVSINGVFYFLDPFVSY